MVASWHVNGQTRNQHKCRIDYTLFLSKVTFVGNSASMMGPPKYDLISLSCGHMVQTTGPADMPNKGEDFFCEACANELNFLS